MKKLAGAVNCRYLLSLLLSILFAFLIGAGILAVSGFHPLEAYGAMLSGAFDSARHIGDFLEYAMVLCVCGLACVLGARVGIFNVGGEGQLLLGAIFILRERDETHLPVRRTPRGIWTTRAVDATIETPTSANAMIRRFRDVSIELLLAAELSPADLRCTFFPSLRSTREVRVACVRRSAGSAPA